MSSPSSVVDVPAVSMTPQQKLSLEEALATVASWDRLMGTEEEEQQGEDTGHQPRSWPPKPQRPREESMNLPLFLRASQECVTPAAHKGRRLSHGSPPSPSGARTPNSPASPAILAQRQWLATELKIAEAHDRSGSPPKDAQQRVAQRAVSPGGQTRAWKPPAGMRRGFPPVELRPAETQAGETGAQPSQHPKKPIAAHTRQGLGLGCFLAAALILLAVLQAFAPDAPRRRTDVAAGGRLHGPLIAAGDAAVLSAQGVLRLCKEEKHCAAMRDQLSHLTPTQRRKLGIDVTIWLASFASLALPSTPLAVLGRAPARLLARLVTALRSALFASRAPPAAATLTTVAVGGAAKAGVGASTARAAAAAAATAAAATASKTGVATLPASVLRSTAAAATASKTVATASKTGVATLPASVLRSPATARTNHLVLELTRRSGAKCVLLEVPLPRAVNPVTSRVLASFPGLAY